LPKITWPWGVCRRGAHTTGGACTTGGPVETEADDGIARDLVSRPPVDTRMPLGTVGRLRLPIHDKGLPVIALTALLVPARRPTGGTDPINLLWARRRDETVSRHGATIAPVGPRPQLPGGSIGQERTPLTPSGVVAGGVLTGVLRSGGAGSQGSVRGRISPTPMGVT
jgi:hypothetical protein